MRVAHDFGMVRIVYDGDPMSRAYDIRVEWMQDGEWKLFSGHNSLSCDYAFTNAREDAERAIKKLAVQAAEAE
jgi:hypothetical protein